MPRIATIARAMCHSVAPAAIDDAARDKAVELAQDFGVLEPRLFEWLAALTYFIGG